MKEFKCIRFESDNEIFFLNFKEIEFDDEGDYKCVVCNEFGSVLS